MKRQPTPMHGAQAEQLEPLPPDVFAAIVDALSTALLKEMRAELEGMVASPSGSNHEQVESEQLEAGGHNWFSRADRFSKKYSSGISPAFLEGRCGPTDLRMSNHKFSKTGNDSPSDDLTVEEEDDF